MYHLLIPFYKVYLDSKQDENSYAYNSFGDLQDSTESSHFNPWRYSLKRWDPETNLIYYGHRYYSPELARWLSPDPAGFHDSRNLYQFLLNNPHYYVDPDGRFLWTIPLIVWGAEGITLSATAINVLTGLAFGSIYLIGQKAIEHIRYQQMLSEMGSEKEPKAKKKPPYSWDENLGYDPTKSPGEGFKWKGKGEPGSNGNWVNEETNEKFNPDLNHPEPKGPHWDYKGPDGKGRFYPNGDFEWK